MISEKNMIHIFSDRYAANWHEVDGVILPPFVHGSARSVGTYKGLVDTCPDGRINAWEATVPNGVYTVTVGIGYGSDGCTLENVRASPVFSSHSIVDTATYSVEVGDGKFTLSGGIPTRCNAVSWLSLDLVSTTLFPRAWLPSPRKEWYV